MKKLIICALCLVFAGAAFASSEQNNYIKAWQEYKQAIFDTSVPTDDELTDDKIREFSLEKFVGFLATYSEFDRPGRKYHFRPTIGQDDMTQADIDAITSLSPILAKTDRQGILYAVDILLFIDGHLATKLRNYKNDIHSQSAYIEYRLMNKALDFIVVENRYLREEGKSYAERMKKINKQLQKLLNQENLDTPVINGQPIGQLGVEKIKENLAQSLSDKQNSYRETTSAAIQQLNTII